MANVIPSDPTTPVSPPQPVASTVAQATTPPLAVPPVTPAAEAAPLAQAAAVEAVPPSVLVELSPAAQLLSSLTQPQGQLGQLQAAAISNATAELAFGSLNTPVPADEQAQLNTNPALAAAIAAYRINENPAVALAAARAALVRRGLINPIPRIDGDAALESETDARVVSEHQQDQQSKTR